MVEAVRLRQVFQGRSRVPDVRPASLLVPLLLLTGALAALGCGSTNDQRAGPAAAAVSEIPSPAQPGSAEPNLASADGRVYLSWLEKRSDGKHALKFSRWDSGRWGAPRTIASGLPFFVNWADFPSLLPMRDGTLVAHWPQSSGEEAEAYDVMVSLSTDDGTTWSSPASPHRDGTATEHGFVSLVDLGQGRFGAVWLDGRKFHDKGTADMSLMFALFENGAFAAEEELDPRVCDCCQTTAVNTRDGVFVAYRDRSPDEVRDISLVCGRSGAWPAPSTLHTDGWEIAGCPVNGPSASVDGDRLVIAWYTQARKERKVLAVFSGDGGRTFGSPVRVDQGKPLGRVGVELLPDGSALVLWLEEKEGSAAEVRARKVRADGRADPHLVLATTRSARASGVPQIARSGDDILFAWTDPVDPPRVRVARLAP